MPPDFVQHKEPKLLVDGLMPVEWPANPDLEWCPPGHGDIYAALLTSGMLEQLLDHGYRYAFMSNSDNLGAVLEPRILAWFAGEGLPYLAELTERTAADKKGGHLGRRKADGGLILRETAQTPDEDMDAFTDAARHPYFHINNLWVDLQALDELLRERDGVLGLPHDREREDGRPRRLLDARRLPARDGDGRGGRRVRRRRGDPRPPLALRARQEDDGPARAPLGRLRPDRRRSHHARRGPRRTLRSWTSTTSTSSACATSTRTSRPAPPSLREAQRLAVKGDVRFGRDVVVRGDVTVGGPREVEDGAVLED